MKYKIKYVFLAVFFLGKAMALSYTADDFSNSESIKKAFNTKYQHDASSPLHKVVGFLASLSDFADEQIQSRNETLAKTVLSATRSILMGEVFGISTTRKATLLKGLPK